MSPFFTRSGLVVLVLAALTVVSPARAAYPERVIKVVVPFPPGGVVDLVLRLLEPALERELGQPVVLENRAGASGIVGTDAVAKAAPDGYTLLGATSSFSVVPVTNAKLPYDPLKDLTAVGLMARDPLIFSVPAAFPAKTLGEFVAQAKARPNAMSFGTPGSDTNGRLVSELFSQSAGVKMQEIPYRGGAPAIMALVAGDVQLTVMSTQLSIPQVQAGKIRAIAVGGGERHPLLPDVPTLTEQGYPQVEAMQWIALFAPGRTPKDIVTRINAALRKGLTDPDVIAKMAIQGATAAASSAEEMQATVAREIAEWQRVARSADISPR